MREIPQQSQATAAAFESSIGPKRHRQTFGETAPPFIVGRSKGRHHRQRASAPLEVEAIIMAHRRYSPSWQTRSQWAGRSSRSSHRRRFAVRVELRTKLARYRFLLRSSSPDDLPQSLWLLKLRTHKGRHCRMKLPPTAGRRAVRPLRGRLTLGRLAFQSRPASSPGVTHEVRTVTLEA